MPFVFAIKDSHLRGVDAVLRSSHLITAMEMGMGMGIQVSSRYIEMTVQITA